MEEKELCPFFSSHFKDYKMGQGREKEVYHTSAPQIRAKKKGYPERRWSLWLTSEWVILIPAADTDATSHSEKRINGLMDFTPDNVYSVIHINSLRCQNKLLNSHPIFSINCGSAKRRDVITWRGTKWPQKLINVLLTSSIISLTVRLLHCHRYCDEKEVASWDDLWSATPANKIQMS